MTVHSLADPAAAPALGRSLDTRPFLVVGLCAAWCDTCTQFRQDFARLAADAATTTFVWLDIEDDADLVGDVDIDNFPTIAVFHADRLIHFGVSLPQPEVVARLLSSLSADPVEASAEPAVRSLRRTLRERLAVPTS